jgi:uncharacterized lipoprotein
MKVIHAAALAITFVLLSGCGGGPQVCNETQPYERSRLGKRIEVPEGLDPLDPSRELTIPEPSPRPPRAANSPCLEVPPSFRIEEEQPPQQAAEDAENDADGA